MSVVAIRQYYRLTFYLYFCQIEEEEKKKAYLGKMSSPRAAVTENRNQRKGE